MASKETTIKKIVGMTAVSLNIVFIGLSGIAKTRKPASVYENEPDERNPFEGKKVAFMEDENEKENADGVKGHLEAVGEIQSELGVYGKYMKRGLDVVLSFGGLVALSPVMGAIALAIKIEDPGPVLFTQKRIGKNKEYFKLHKFRSMKVSTPHDVPTHQLENPEQYITKVGKFIRAHSLDELPQIWDIFIGNMSVIGPRPALWNQDLLTAERDKYGANDIKPGLTGWAQINGRDELEITDKARLDGEYCNHVCLKLDTKVFLSSIHVFNKDGTVVEGGTGNMKNEENHKAAIAERKNRYSVLMSVYQKDNPAFLKLALESIYNKQTVKPDEIIVVFDGPLTEQLYDILNEFKSDKEDVVKYYPQEINRGLGEALRIGSDYCSGDYIFRMDSDDISDPRRFEKQITYIETHPDVDVLGTGIDEFQTSINEKKRRRICPADMDRICNMAKHRNPMNHVTVCIKKSALEGCGGYESLLLLEDYYLWLKMIASGYKLVNMEDILVHVRVGNEFDSKRGAKERVTGWKELQNYMLHYHMINRKEAWLNMIYIKTFINMPNWARRLSYERILRK